MVMLVCVCVCMKQVLLPTSNFNMETVMVQGTPMTVWDLRWKLRSCCVWVTLLHCVCCPSQCMVVVVLLCQWQE